MPDDFLYSLTSIPCDCLSTAKLSKQELKDSVLKKVREDDDGVMLDAMLPRKQKRLYEAMQIGIARKQAKVNEIKDRKNLLAKKKPAK